MTEQQAQELLAAAIAWQEQGARSKWKSELSLKLWDTVDRIKKAQGEGRVEEPFPSLHIEKLLFALLNRLFHRLVDAVA